MNSLASPASQELCTPVAEGFGTSVPAEVTEMMTMQGASVLSEAVVEQQRWAGASHEERGGEPYRRVARELGCDACILSGCEVRQIVNERASAEGKLAVVDQLLGAPNWLTAARVATFGRGSFDLLKDPEYVQRVTSSGELDPRELLGGVESEVDRFLAPDEVPELQGINIKADAGNVGAYRITRTDGAGQQIEVIDATDIVASGVKPPEASQQAVLVQKLLERMTNYDRDGKPHIQTPDNKMQKGLRVATRPGPGRLDELRMNGKNRMYIIVTEATETAPVRVVILGSHGGDGSTQNQFISNVLASTSERQPVRA